MDYYDLIEKQEITSYERMMISQPYTTSYTSHLDMWIWWVNFFNPLIWFI